MKIDARRRTVMLIMLKPGYLLRTFREWGFRYGEDYSMLDMGKQMVVLNPKLMDAIEDHNREGER